MLKNQIISLLRAAELDLNIQSGLLVAIADIESSFNNNAVGAAGEIGLMQLLPKGGAISDYELIHGKELQGRYGEILTNIRVGAWFVGVRIPQLLRKYDKPVTVENIIICYNAGIGNLVKGNIPASTLNYIAKARKLIPVYAVGAAVSVGNDEIINHAATGQKINWTAIITAALGVLAAVFSRRK